MSFQIAVGSAAVRDLKVFRRADNDQALIRAKRHGDHVARKMLGQPYAGVEAVFHNIDKTVVGDDVHGHLADTGAEIQRRWAQEFAAHRRPKH